ncbi:unnamed protein product [Peniophora sp. CBMAI 1063]|nr:unnamed protein product [Peniophora sp. CBMAI 1063]
MSSLGDYSIWNGSIEDAYACVHAFFEQHIHGDPRFIYILAGFATTCTALRHSVLFEDPPPLRARLELLIKAHQTVEQDLWCSIDDIIAETDAARLKWSKLKDNHIQPLASLFSNTESLTHADVARAVFVVSELRREAKEVLSCADRNPLLHRGPCSLCYVEDRPSWTALEKSSTEEACYVFLTCPRVRNGSLCTARDIERTFMKITQPSTHRAPRCFVSSLGIPHQITDERIRPDFVSMHAVLWMICSYPISSLEAAKLKDVLFLYVRIKHLEPLLECAIRALATPHISDPLPDGISLAQFHRSLIYTVRDWHCLYANGTGVDLEAPPSIKTLIHSDILDQWPRLRYGLEKVIIPLTQGKYAPGPGLRAAVRHDRRRTGTTGYDDTLFDRFEEGYGKRVKRATEDAKAYWARRALPLPAKVKLHEGYAAGMSASSIISNIAAEGIRAFVYFPEKLAWVISCIQARLYGCIDFESIVVHMCRHVTSSPSIPRMFCEDCQNGVDNAFLRERQFTEAIPLWVLDTIVSQKASARRVEVTLMWIKVANALMSIRNWSGLRMVTHALVFLLSEYAYKHVPLPDVSIRAMRRLHVLVFEKAPGTTQSHIDDLERTVFTGDNGEDELSLPYLGRFHETMLDLASNSARTCKSMSANGTEGDYTTMRLSAYEEIVQTIDWYEGVNIGYVSARGERSAQLAEEAFTRRKDEPGVTLSGCQTEQRVLDRTLEGYVRQELKVVRKRSSCPAQGREKIAAPGQPLPQPPFRQEAEKERAGDDVTIGDLLAAIHTHIGDIAAEAKKEEEPLAPEPPSKRPSFVKTLSSLFTTPFVIEVVWK